MDINLSKLREIVKDRGPGVLLSLGLQMFISYHLQTGRMGVVSSSGLKLKEHVQESL